MYSIKGLADLAGISTRTLRFYDEKGILKPSSTNEAGYRFYGETEVDKLQQIMFLREMDIPLADIGEILNSPEFDRKTALESHLKALKERRERIDALILTVNKTLNEMQGGEKMSNQEKFEAFKRQMVDENEEKYGEEVRSKYGDATADASNATVMGMNQEQFKEWEDLSVAIKEGLKKAVNEGENPEGEEGLRIAGLHRKWLSGTMKTVSDEMHMGLAQMYVADERFTAYYDSEVSGCAEFLKDAVQAYVNK